MIAEMLVAWLALALAQSRDPRVAELARELHDKGWIIFGARSPQGDWDLFVMRPDGTDLKNITRTPDTNEGLPRYSPDGTRILFRRIPKSERFDNNRHGLQGELVLANADGTGAEPFGKPGEYPWASWSSEGKKIACLSAKGIEFVDLATRKVLSSLDRKSFFQQMTWSPDGKWLSGVANSFDTGWSVARMEVATGMLAPVSKVDCCTPDWFPDSKALIFSRRPGEWTELWMADLEGKQRSLVYAEEGRHCYGGCVSPDGKYILFTGNKEEDGDAGNAGAPMAILRLRDAPVVGGESRSTRRRSPGVKDGPVLTLPVGWEPHWTAPGKGAAK
jgi:hypothetical protein